MDGLEEAGALIWGLWQRGEVIDALPQNLRPTSRREGYEAQTYFERCSALPRAGFKIAATSVAGQRHIGVDGPLAGRLLAERIHRDGATIPITHNRMRVAEPEFAFRFAADIAPRAKSYDVAEVMAAVSTMHLAIELPDSRFRDFASVGGPSLIADNACARDFVIGEAVAAGWRAVDLAKHTVHATVGSRYERAGIGSNVLGDPRIALAWLVNEVGGLGITLRAGEVVSTGTCAVPLEIEPGDHVVADFGAFGRISVRVA